MDNNNRKIRKTIVFIMLIAMFLLAGCATTVSFSSLVPAEVNMTGYKTVAFASTQPYGASYGRNYIDIKTGRAPVPYSVSNIYYSPEDRDLYKATARYATKALEKSLDKGVYTIIHSDQTDSLINGARALGYTVRRTLMEKGIDVLITSNVSNQKVYQWVSCSESKDKEGKITYRYYLNTEAELAIDYVVQDVENAIVIDRGTLKKQYTQYSPEFIGSLTTKAGEKDVWSEGWYTESVTGIFESLINSLTTNFYKRLTPYQKTTSFALKESKTDAMKAALECAENGQYAMALSMFLNEWNTKGDINAAYDAVVMLAATEGFEKAIIFADDIYKNTYNPDIQKLSVQLQTIWGLDLRAKQQITGPKGTITRETELSGF